MVPSKRQPPAIHPFPFLHLIIIRLPSEPVQMDKTGGTAPSTTLWSSFVYFPQNRSKLCTTTAPTSSSATKHNCTTSGTQKSLQTMDLEMVRRRAATI